MNERRMYNGFSCSILHFQLPFFYVHSYASMLLSIESKGLIDCYHDGCNWQGVEYRQYDLRNQAAREFYVHRVIGDLISSPSLDGTFIDVIVR